MSHGDTGGTDRTADADRTAITAVAARSVVLAPGSHPEVLAELVPFGAQYAGRVWDAADPRSCHPSGHRPLARFVGPLSDLVTALERCGYRVSKPSPGPSGPGALLLRASCRTVVVGLRGGDRAASQDSAQDSAQESAAPKAA